MVAQNTMKALLPIFLLLKEKANQKDLHHGITLKTKCYYGMDLKWEISWVFYIKD